MADKKQFTIVINGVRESVDAVKTLKGELQDCEDIIKRLKDAKIDVKVSAGTTKPTEKVSSGKSSDEKVALDIEKEKTKQVEMQNDALREQYVERERLKQSNKESLDDIKEEAKGYIEINDGVKTYANTLNGMSAELKDIKKELRNTDIDTEDFDKLTERAAELNEKLKKAEEAYGQFGRNVGNYTQSILDALDEWDENREFNVDLNVSGAENSLNDLKAQLKELKQYWANLSPDDANFDKTAKAIKSLNQQIQDMESSLKDVGAEANSAFTGRFTTTIGGVEASFSNASEACEALRKKLVAMRVAGEENTPMYQEIIQLVRRLSKEVKIAQNEIAGMTKTTQNMGKVISVMRGLSGLAALGQGIAGLFGGASEDLDKFIQKFASMTMVIAGLKELEELINSGEGAWGKLAQSANDALNKIVSPLSKLADGTKAMKDFVAAQKELQALQEAQDLNDQRWQELYTEINNATGACQEFKNVLDEISALDAFDNWDDIPTEEFEDLNNAVEELKNKFPGLSDKIDEFIQTCKKSDDQQDELVTKMQEYQETIDKMGPVTQRAASALANMGVVGKGLTVVINGLTVALKALAKATIVLFALQLLAEAVGLLTDGMKKLGSALGIGKAWDSLKQSVQNFFGVISGGQIKKLNNDLDTLQKKLDGLSKEYDIQVKIGNMGDAEAQIQRLNDQLQLLAQTKELFDKQDQFIEWQEQLQTELDKTDSGWKDLTKTQQDAAEGLQALTKLNKGFIDSLKDKTPQEQLQAIDDKLRAIGLDSDKLAAIESVLSQDDEAIEKFLSELSDIDWDLNDIGVDGVKAFGKLGTAISKARSDAAAAVGRIKSDLKSLENQNIQLQLQLDPTNATLAFQNAMSSMAAMAQQYGITMSSDGLKFSAKEGDATGQAIAKQLEANAALQKKIIDKQIADRKKQDAERAKSERERAANEAKQRAAEAKKRARNEAAARLEALEDGLDKEIALLEQKRKEEIEDAKETGKRVVDINTIYDRQVLEVKKKYAKYIEDAEREHTKRLEDIAKEFASQWVEIQRQIEDERADTSLGQVENKNMSVKQSITYDVSTQGTSEGIDAQKEYYNQMRDLQNEYITEKEQLDIEAAQREHQRLIEDENARFNSEKEAYEAEIEEQKRALQEKVDNAQISQVEMDRLITELQDAYHKGEQERLEQHNEKIAAITEHGEEVVTTIQLEAQEERQKNNIDSFNNQLDAIQDFYNNIDKVMERTQKRKTNQFGFIDYGEYRKSLKDALDATKQTAEQIEQQKAQLQADLNAKKISFDDFQKAKKQLDEFAEEVKDKTKEMQDNLNQSFNSWMGGIMNTVNQYASVLSGMFDVVNEMYTRELDAQQEALDKKQELLDEELEMLDEQLQKQEEITQGHKDKINSVEDELKSARGDRRQALVDQLAAERKAADESMKKEKQVTEEKKKNQKKQEQLKKEQDALDKKRKKQEQKVAIVQATINMFTAMSNALAVQPWFLGLALMGVAAGLGAANIAQIASQKYADGGLLNGKRHSQGGMKIQGTNMEVEGGEYVTNRASTSANLPLLEYINSNRRTLTKDDLVKFYDNGKTTLINRPMQTKFEEGGQLPQLSVDVKSLMNSAQAQGDDRPLVVSVVDIVNAAENLQQVRVLSGDTMND